MTRRARKKNASPAATELRPPVRHSDPPPWYEISEDLFEDLCCDVHGLGAAIKSARRYGLRGQRQRGIDIIADRTDGKREAAQCKCYRDFTKVILDRAVRKFKDNLDLWRQRAVVAFRIYSASEVRSTKVLDAFHAYQKEFHGLGLELELCDGRELSRILTPYRSIVSKYLGSHWTDIICGPLQSISPGDLDHRVRGLEIQLDAGVTALGELADSLSRHVAERIEEIRERYRRGHRRAAKVELQRILDDGSWPQLSPAVRSRALRLMALYTVNLDGDTRAARELAARADPAVQDSLSLSLEALLRLKDHQEIPAQTTDATPEILHLRAAALLESGRASEAVEALTSESVVRDAETNRLLALAYLALGKVALARDAVDNAARSKPSWLSVREANAIITFWEGAGAAAGLPVDRYLPGPFPAELVRADDTAVRRISDAAGLFARLGEEADDPDEQWRLRLWQFVCLANSPLREQTLGVLRALLEKDPASPIVLGWALTRRLPIDRDRALQGLAAATPGQPDYLDRIGIRVGLLIESGQAEAGLRLIEESSEVFLQAGHGDALAHWRVEALVALERLEEATSVVRSVADEAAQGRLRLQTERARAGTAGDSTPLLRALEEAYRRSGGMDLLLEIVERQIRAGNAESVDGFIDDLVRGLPTPSAIRLAARARWEAGRPRACLELLNGHASAFPGQELPEDLRRLRVHCRRKLGYLVEAIEDARLIAQVENTAQAWVELLEAQTDHGDLAGMEDTARRILAVDDVSQSELLRAAGVVAIGSSALARQLWERVIARGPLEDALVPVAFTLGNQLGIADPELTPLGQRIAELGSSGSSLVRPMSIQGALEVMRTSRQQAEDLHAKYAHGEIPLHILPDKYRPLVIEAFSTAHPVRNGPLDPFVELPIFARHGGWPIRDATPLCGMLMLDVTSLVLAASLGILGRLINAFDSVLIPRATQRLLLSEISRLRPQQPLRSAATQRVLERIRSGGIVVEPEPIPWSGDRSTRGRMGAWWITRIEHVSDQGGLSVDFLPLTANDGNSEPPEIPDRLLGCITSPHAVARALADGGVLSEGELHERLARLASSAGPSDGVPIPRRGQRLFISSVMAELLSQSDLLSVCCDYFSIVMYVDDRARVAAEVEGDELRSGLAEWGQDLVREITHRVEAGHLLLITPAEGGDDSPSIDSLATECLLDLLRADVPDGVVCCDDRFVNRHALIGQRPTISLPDLLASLRRAGHMTQQAFFDAVSQLRRANYRFLPLSSGEIVYQLRRTRVRRGCVEESNQLSTLRTWWAGCCLAHSTLQKPGEQADGSSEAAFLLNSRRAITDSMHAVWSDTRTGPGTRAARARWLLDALFVGLVESHHQMPAPRQDDGKRTPALAGADVALLCSAALSLRRTRPARGTAKPAGEEYLDWLVENYIGSILAADRDLSEAAATSLRDLILGMLRDVSEGAQRTSLLLLLGRFLEKLPEQLRESLGRDPAMAKLFGFRSYSTVEIVGQSFDLAEFWEACSAAINGQRCQVRPLQGGYYLYLRRDESAQGSPVLEVVRADASVAGRMADPLFGVLSAHRAEIVATLERMPQWTDSDGRPYDEIAGELERLGAVQRVELVHSLAGRSTADHYHCLEAEFPKDHRLSIDQVAPWDLDPVARYFRLADVEASARFEAIWSSACTALIDDLGLGSALNRILCVPSRAPGLVIDRIDALQDPEAKALLREKFNLGFSPVFLINLLRITASPDPTLKSRDPG